jgi:hypothetical protein
MPGNAAHAGKSGSVSVLSGTGPEQAPVKGASSKIHCHPENV